MNVVKHIVLFLFAFSIVSSYAQSRNPDAFDTTISIFWNPSLKVQIVITNPDEPNPQRNNTVVTLFETNQNGKRIIFKDSLFAYMLLLKMMDLNGDGNEDLLVYNTNNGPDNKSYHLYVVDQKQGNLKRIKGFEKVLNPYYYEKKCLILGFQSLERRLIQLNYIIDPNGILAIVTD